MLVVNAANLIYQFWVHTQLIRRMGVLDYILVTPSNHRVHHAQNQRYIDKNYGGVLILWDRMFGTFEDERDDDPVVFGVRKPLGNWNPFWANFQIYNYLLFDARHTKAWKDKFGIWFRRTGWRPADVAEQFPKSRADLSTFVKFDPQLEPGLKAYVLFQFLIVLGQALYVSGLFATASVSTVLIPCVLLWSHVYMLGVLNEARPYAVQFEIVRLVIVVPIGAAVFFGVSNFVPIVWAAAYCTLSLWALMLASPSRDAKRMHSNQ